MPLHNDNPDAPGNLSDDEYRAAVEALITDDPDQGLHVIPDDILEAATAAALAKAAEQ